MKTKSLLLAILAGTIGVAVTCVMVWKHEASNVRVASESTAPARAKAPEKAPPPAIAVIVPSRVPADLTPQLETPKVSLVAETKPKSGAPQIKRAAKAKPEIQNPAARLALSFVGMDAEAEACWMAAINDPNLPAEERKDLIEDLNEDGLSNPHQPTSEDMALIASRIELIEELAPYAADQVNLDAFKEAYKDLINLLNGLPAD